MYSRWWKITKFLRDVRTIMAKRRSFSRLVMTCGATRPSSVAESYLFMGSSCIFEDLPHAVNQMPSSVKCQALLY